MAKALGWELRDVMKATALAWAVVTARGTGRSEPPRSGPVGRRGRGPLQGPADCVLSVAGSAPRKTDEQAGHGCEAPR